MNKIFSKLTKLAMLAAGALMLASFSPSLDGRAVVVDEGVMPSGLFAKTVGYLPGDVISVTNVAQNKNVDLLVIGALDASEGVAIMLTPEAAQACGIEKDSNSIVKITKRNGQDDRVYGNAVISSASDNQAAAPEKTVKDNPSADSVAEEVFQEEAVPEVAEEAEKSDCGPSLADTERTESSENNASAFAAAPVTAPVYEEEDAFQPEEVAAVNENEAETPLIEKAEDTREAQNRAAEHTESVITAAPLVEEEVTQTPFEEDPVEDVVEAENTNTYAEAAPFTYEEPFTQISSSDYDESDDSESYDAIVLVPSAANPPVSDSPYSASSEVCEKSEPVFSPYTPSVSATPKAPVTKADLTYQNFMVSGSGDLKRNSYYVQIATMRDDANIQEVVNKYGNNYPITIVPVKNNSKQILIGSLNMDEYAVVLERFKSYGYKDAFLRKIK
ncbi:hypothetical protein [Treponema sp. C6A8]|uniref:hypothetical protein n=1 Tax=Treponema sp. C6A8 TaxID=1410609 RepID=UPI000488A3CC|nr:hypothetical protein [Treponema sp. C6A8]